MNWLKRFLHHCSGSRRNVWLYSLAALLIAVTLLLLVFHLFKSNGRMSDFFRNSADAMQVSQSFVARVFPGKNVSSIRNISYLSDQKKRTAIVFYYTGRDSGALFIQKPLMDTGRYTAKICTRLNCPCEIFVNVDSAGCYYTTCGCGSCTYTDLLQKE